MARYAPGETFDLGAVYRNVNEMRNRNALTESRIGSNALDNEYRRAQIADLERGGGLNLGPTNPRDFTAESMAIFERTGDRNDLVRYETLIPQKRGGVNGVLDRRTGVWAAGQIGLDQELNAAAQMEARKREAILKQDLNYLPQIESNKVGAGQNAAAGLTISGAPSGNTTEAENAAAKRAAETTAGGQATRGQDWINRAASASEAYPVLGRAIQLLEGGTETGGWDNVQLMASNFFGVTGADEAELSNNLGKAVLSQLRETFGAAFTVEEGRRLEGIEANYGKSTEGNKRLLKQAQKILNEVMKRGIKAATDSGDTAALESINRGYTFDLSMPNDAPAANDFSAMTDEQLKAIAEGN